MPEIGSARDWLAYIAAGLAGLAAAVLLFALVGMLAPGAP